MYRIWLPFFIGTQRFICSYFAAKESVAAFVAAASSPASSKSNACAPSTLLIAAWSLAFTADCSAWPASAGVAYPHGAAVSVATGFVEPPHEINAHAASTAAVGCRYFQVLVNRMLFSFRSLRRRIPHSA